MASLSGADPERRAMARLYLAGLEELLVAAGGRPEGARPVPGLRPPVYWWRYHSGWWMRYCVADVRRWFGRSERRVIVLEVADRSPPGA